jgi:hypothetical protein
LRALALHAAAGNNEAELDKLVEIAKTNQNRAAEIVIDARGKYPLLQGDEQRLMEHCEKIRLPDTSKDVRKSGLFAIPESISALEWFDKILNGRAVISTDTPSKSMQVRSEAFSFGRFMKNKIFCSGMLIPELDGVLGRKPQGDSLYAIGRIVQALAQDRHWKQEEKKSVPILFFCDSEADCKAAQEAQAYFNLTETKSGFGRRGFVYPKIVPVIIASEYGNIKPGNVNRIAGISDGLFPHAIVCESLRQFKERMEGKKVAFLRTEYDVGERPVHIVVESPDLVPISTEESETVWHVHKNLARELTREYN